jgi:hypothetical protein
MTVLINLRTSEEEKELLAFLNKKHYDYQKTTDFPILTIEQEKEIIRRDNAFAQGKTAARNWEEIKWDLANVYR